MRIHLHRYSIASEKTEKPEVIFEIGGGGALLSAIHAFFSSDDQRTFEASIGDGGILGATVILGREVLKFRINGVRDEDEFNLKFVRFNYFRAWVEHNSRAASPLASRPPRCRAVCGNGKEGFPCVTCESAGLIGEVCC